MPAYASTYYFASERGGFDTPESFADFAEQCLEMEYPAFKLHTWRDLGGTDVGRECEAVAAAGERVGDRMDMMHDPVSQYETFADSLAVGNVCDEYGYLWYEDPYMDTGQSQHAHRKLRDHLETPILQTELVRGVEPHADWITAEATDFVRADPDWDGGVTGTMKIARIAEGFGLDVEFHLAGPAQRHCMAATRNSNYYEMGLVHPDSQTPHTELPVYENGPFDSFDGVDDSGTVPVPDGAGLSVTYDWGAIDDLALRTRVYD